MAFGRGHDRSLKENEQTCRSEELSDFGDGHIAFGFASLYNRNSAENSSIRGEIIKALSSLFFCIRCYCYSFMCEENNIKIYSKSIVEIKI